jgi:hypothetical protein
MDNLQERVEALEHDLRTLKAHAHTVERRLRWWRRLAWGLVVLSLVSLGQSSSSAQEERLPERHQNLAPRLDDLGDTLRKLRKLLTHITITKDDEGRLEIILSGVNLRIVNGLGQTDCIDEQGSPLPNCPNGLGNLIVGYNEEPDVAPPFVPEDRSGSHNLIIGRGHRFRSSGGFVAGSENTIDGIGASISGGFGSVASGGHASVSGGFGNTASGGAASIGGGGLNTASGTESYVAGGEVNTASGFQASVIGGFRNVASGFNSSVSGGQFNTASGNHAAVSGGRNRTAEGEFDWVAGSLVEDE